MEEGLNMGRRDMDKNHVIRNILDKKVSQVDGAKILGLSDRQIRRLCVRYRAKGARGIVHGLRGRPSNHQLDPL